MHPVRVPPAPSSARTSLPEAVHPAVSEPTARAMAFLDAVCPCCEQRGLELAASATGEALLVCLHCGHVGDG